MKKLIFLFALFLISCSDRNIYDTKVVDINGNRINIGELKSKGLVVYLWTGTCIGHTRDLKRLGQLYEEGKITRKVVSIAIMMDPEDISEFKRKNSISDLIPFYADPEGKIADVIKITFLPSTIIIDERGKVTGNYPGLAEKLLTSVTPHN